MKRKDIRFLVMDVDGTLTDGRIYTSEKGELFKAFDVKDGYGIKNILPAYGIIPVIITGRKSTILEIRCAELGIRHVYQGVSDKTEVLLKVLKSESENSKQELGFRSIAFIGDDTPDLSCMTIVKKAGGITACPSDAWESVLREADFVCKRNGGSGAVREFIEYLTE